MRIISKKSYKDIERKNNYLIKKSASHKQEIKDLEERISELERFEKYLTTIDEEKFEDFYETPENVIHRIELEKELAKVLSAGYKIPKQVTENIIIKPYDELI